MISNYSKLSRATLILLTLIIISVRSQPIEGWDESYFIKYLLDFGSRDYYEDCVYITLKNDRLLAKFGADGARISVSPLLSELYPYDAVHKRMKNDTIELVDFLLKTSGTELIVTLVRMILTNQLSFLQ